MALLPLPLNGSLMPTFHSELLRVPPLPILVNGTCSIVLHPLGLLLDGLLLLPLRPVIWNLQETGRQSIRFPRTMKDPFLKSIFGGWANRRRIRTEGGTFHRVGAMYHSSSSIQAVKLVAITSYSSYLPVIDTKTTITGTASGPRDEAPLGTLNQLPLKVLPRIQSRGKYQMAILGNCFFHIRSSSSSWAPRYGNRRGWGFVSTHHPLWVCVSSFLRILSVNWINVGSP